jgi:6,7-dimethyl-8-ribityllumazine synthase
MTSLVTVVAVCFSFVILARLPKDSEISSMMKSVTSLGQAVRGGSMSFDVIAKVVGKVVSQVFQIKYGVPTEISELEVFMTGIQ